MKSTRIIRRAIFAGSTLAMLIGTTEAIEITIAMAEGNRSDVLDIPISVDDSTGIAAAAFTVAYETASLEVGVESTFFESFADQFAATGADPSAVPFVEIDGVQIDSPILVNRLPGKGLAVAGVRRSPADGTKNTLFNLRVSLGQDAEPGLYDITITPTIVAHTSAGYDAAGEELNLLIGKNANDGAFPVLLDASGSEASIDPGSARFVVDLTDEDGDGLRDDWERENFGNLDQTAEGDPDEDGLNNLGEHEAGTDPTEADTDGDGIGDADEVAGGTDPLDPNDPTALAGIFQIFKVSHDAAANSVTITWTSLVGKSYIVETAPDLKSWTEVTDGYPSEGETTSFTVEGIPPGNLDLYVRVREE